MSVEGIHRLSDAIFKRLTHSQSFEEYEAAFSSATGLPMRLVAADASEWNLNERRKNQSPFCEMINPSGEDACEACVEVNRDLMHESSINGPASRNCFAGLRATSIPVCAGTIVVGFLKTGQVFHQPPSEADFNSAVKLMLKSRSFTDEQVEHLRTAYYETITVSPERYRSMVTLLKHFACELSSQSEELAIVASEQEPPPIIRARKHIHSQLEETISLPEVARVAGMSKSHFCRQFKTTTGMTLTEYINYARVLRAKEELLKPGTRISEIAFGVGFQSLSQFNRCFIRFHGSSPSRYRADVTASAVKAS